MLKGLRALISFFTRIPTGVFDLGLVSDYMYLVPLVGLVEGIIIASLIMISQYFFYTIIVAMLYIVFHLLLTGGIHIDGFTDYIEALWSGRKGEEMLKIMKDPRKGVFGISALTINILVSLTGAYVILTIYSLESIFLLIVFIYILSCESLFLLSWIGKAEPYEGLSRSIVIKADRHASKNIIVFSILLLPFFYLSLYISLELVFKELIMLIASILIVLYSKYESEKNLGFVNGDVLGFTYELVRITCIIISGVVIHVPTTVSLP
jgi:adenosylcobinamide-GDP ribazoletransferase